MKIEATNLRPGNVVQYNNVLCRVVKVNHVMQGRGKATIHAEFRTLDGIKLNVSLRSSESVERVYLDEKKYQYLYQEGELLTLMDMENYEQILVDKSLLGDEIVFLQDDMKLIVALYNDKPITITLPDHVVLKVIEAEPVIKGQTASSSYKPALLENNVRVMVPPFISVDEKIVVKTADSTYVERFKE